MVEMQQQEQKNPQAQQEAPQSQAMQVDETSAQLAELSLEGGDSPQQRGVKPNAPVVLIVLGMAGSGKTTFVHRLISHMSQHGKKTYNMNLDPAVLDVQYPCNIDIRDSVKYKKVMKSYSLGPNGAILTCLNLFAAQFDQVVNLIQKKEDQLDYVIVDTPGQIEAFSQSASGQIITQAFACTFPTMSFYVADTVRCQNPNTFMSNMMYALSILYKSKTPLMVLFNKIDVIDCSFASEWMTDFQAFDDALAKQDNYLSTLSRSMSLVLEEFYEQVPNIGVSSKTGKGFDKIEEKVAALKKEYFEVFLPELLGKNGGQGGEEGEEEESRLPEAKFAGMPSSAVGPNKEVLAEKVVQEQQQPKVEDSPAEGTNELEQLD